MNMKLKSLALLASMFAVGCGGDSMYHPPATDTVLSSHAANEKYPTGVSAEKSPDIFYNIEENGVITLYNAGDTSLLSFTLWANRSYSLFVDKLPAHQYRKFAPETLYNSTGGNLTLVQPQTVTSIQVLSNTHLYDLAGPCRPGN